VDKNKVVLVNDTRAGTMHLGPDTKGAVTKVQNEINELVPEDLAQSLRQGFYKPIISLVRVLNNGMEIKRQG